MNWQKDSSGRIVVWSLNAKFEPDHDKADKSAKLCIQFPWDMSMKSEVGAQEKNFLLPYKMGNTFHHCAAVLGNHAFSYNSICDSFEG